MPLAVTDRDRWLALVLLLAALLLGYFVLVHPWWTVPMQEVGARVGELRERELRIRTQLQQAPQVRRELDAALAQHRRAIARDRGADARNHRVVTGDRFALVVPVSYTHLDVYKRQEDLFATPLPQRLVYVMGCLLYTSRCV